ncbi:Muskelin [Crucibulum laeve]|uniref:Muskelin n=1 Tax=Crucibulum laeve TaxID=68775 RepID=A0A5C3LPU3_9AGAR|nr:Muskelin [Crucibulum laeve]
MSGFLLSPEPPSVPLTYSILKATKHSGQYVPDNILVDKPMDSLSRWSGEGIGTEQWILLRLEAPSVLKSITFGKLSKAHPCNMKDFKFLIGPSEDKLTEILSASLKNDTIPETFALKHINSVGIPFPTHYVKIAPISSHAPKFNISIWHVSMNGINDPVYVAKAQIACEEYREISLRDMRPHL